MASTKKLQKSYFDVLGLCCSSEVPLVENILNSLEGIKEYSVVVPTRTVIVVHDALIISQHQIAKALNQARLEANVRVDGNSKFEKRWPSPYAVASGALLLVSFLKYVYPPLHWVALGSVAVGIIPLSLKGIAAVRNLRLDTSILMLIAVVGTVCLRDYTEAATIVFLFSIAEWLEARAGHKAQAVMSSLMSLAPQKAVIAETGEQVDVDEVKLNTILAVKAGEVIPIDGVVVDGKCEVDEKSLTGESFPVPKEKDSTVWAGTINTDGYVNVKTTALAEDCVVAKMTKLVEEAQNSKSKTQRFIDRCAQYYTPAVIVLSASFAVVPFALRVHNLSHWLHLALVVLVSACPCALILSTPVATFCALTKAATAGLLIKGGDYLETLAKVKVMAFDKTGTLTRGEFVVNDFESLSHDISSETLLYWASSIESKSSHPMAAALVDYARSRLVEPKPENVEEFQNYPGEGIHGKIDGSIVYIGNGRISARAGSETIPTIDCHRAKGKTIGFIFSQGKAVGVFSLSDICRTGVKEALKDLQSLNIKTAMLTGDSQSAAIQTQQELGHALKAVHSELLPEDKAKIIESFKKEGVTAMVGDGINDAPALATADIGISMGVSGSALATETGKVILMSNDLRKVPKAIQLAQKAQRKVVENVILSITTKAAIVALAIAGHPLVWAAVLADVGTCLLVIMNSMMLLHGTQGRGGKCCKSPATIRRHKHGGNHSSGNSKHCCADKEVANMCKAEDFPISTSSCKSKSCGNSECSNLEERHQDSLVCTSSCNSKSCRNSECSDSEERHQDSTIGTSSCKSKACKNSECSDLENKHQDFPVGTSSCKSRSCRNSKCSDLEKRHHDQNEACSLSKQNQCHNGCCQLVSTALEANGEKQNECLGHLQSSICKGNAAPGEAKCLSESQHNAKTNTCQGVNDHCSRAIHSIKGQSPRKHTSDPCCEDTVNSHTKEACCSDQHQYPKLEHDHQRCCEDKGDLDQITLDILPDEEISATGTKHACLSLEKRNLGGCCRSYVKQCCSQHVHLPNCGFGSSLSEIITE